ncbi:MAG: molybdopterin-guanine dinucleotide biosynthesis protein B [Gemmatimonadales bacterium]|nr:molybdopterin-guanine dinucleotide biosynthesis protein B [Gemmatimonadales bacterium]
MPRGEPVPIVSVVGRKNSGKTTLVEALVRELSRRGHRVGTIKHDAHGFEIDHEGKDSWRHKRAGAETVVIASASKVAMVMVKSVTADPGPYALASTLLGDMDIIIAEGYRKLGRHRVEVVCSATGAPPLCAEDEVIAFVSDARPSAIVPCFGIEEIGSLADMLEQKLLSSAPISSLP